MPDPDSTLSMVSQIQRLGFATARQLLATPAGAPCFTFRGTRIECTQSMESDSAPLDFGGFDPTRSVRLYALAPAIDGLGKNARITYNGKDWTVANLSQAQGEWVRLDCVPVGK